MGVFVVGGEDFHVTMTNTEVFNPALGTWTILGPLSAPRFGASMIVVDGKIYAIGGGDYADDAGVELLDPGLGTWATLPSMASHRADSGIAAVGSKIYVMGGLD